MAVSLIQNTATVTSASANVAPSITGVTAGNVLISTCTSSSTTTIAAPTDSAGQIWSIAFQTSNASSGTVAIAYLLNANSGTHTVTWPTVSQIGIAAISEWNGITALSAATGASANSVGVTGITTSSYTPATSNEVLIGVAMETGSSSPDNVACTTVGFQTLGSNADASSNSCLMIQQNGSAFNGAEANGQIISSASAVTCSWTWTPSRACIAALMGFTYTPASIGTASIAWVT